MSRYTPDCGYGVREILFLIKLKNTKINSSWEGMALTLVKTMPGRDGGGPPSSPPVCTMATSHSNILVFRTKRAQSENNWKPSIG